MKKPNINPYTVTRSLLGLMLIAVGLFALESGPIDLNDFTHIVRVTLIIFGIFVIIRAFAKS